MYILTPAKMNIDEMDMILLVPSAMNEYGNGK